MVNKHMKKCTKSLAIKERQIKTTIRGVPWWLSGLRIQCGTAVVWVQSLSWELLHTMGMARTKKPKILPLEATTCLLKWLKLKLLTEPIANEDAEQWNFSYIVGENVKCYLCVNIHNSFLCKSSRIRSTQIQWVNE